MNHEEWLNKQAQITMARLLPRCKSILTACQDASLFFVRAEREFPRLFRLLFELYGSQYDFFYHLEQIMMTAARMFAQRPPELRVLDQQREANPLWFQSHEMVGGVCYVDLFAGDLSKMHSKIPYLKELGLSYLHLMPLFKSPKGDNDGGYAISDYRMVDAHIGTMQQLAGLAAELRREGISLVLDFVFNHTSDEHEWARRALAGEEEFQNYYYIFPNRTMPNQYEATMREIFPEQAPGSFTYRPELDSWVWTSFYNFQWDLNYHNPAVFDAMLEEMLFLANQGVEVLRLDAVAFIWKELGTSSENRPQAHMIIQAYNALIKIVAPAMLFKSEAIVHPDDVISYVSWNEAPISYNPTMMALMWEALATRSVRLLQQSMSRRYWLPDNCTWINYMRVHDDIGWTFADEDAAELWINAYEHRRFLNSFYSGDFEGSFARGIPFGYNAQTGDMRISGTAASLCGLEKALEQKDEAAIDLSLKRLTLLFSIIISAGGIPLIYLGDEVATMNDYSFHHHPRKRNDSRWVHRVLFDWERAKKRHDMDTTTGQLFQTITKLISIRKTQPLMGKGPTTFFPTYNDHVLGYVRNQNLLILANFTERPQHIERDVLAAYVAAEQTACNLLTGADINLDSQVELESYEFIWLVFDQQ